MSWEKARVRELRSRGGEVVVLGVLCEGGLEELGAVFAGRRSSSWKEWTRSEWLVSEFVLRGGGEESVLRGGGKDNVLTWGKGESAGRR